MKLLVGIPAYNEAEMIGKVVTALPKTIRGIKEVDILVVDDGSTDNTRAIAKKHGAKVAVHLLNRGLGGALKTILGYAKETNYDLLVTFDADGQHEGQEIEKLINPIINNKADVVIGTRWKNEGKKPIVRFVVNQLANVVTYLLFGMYSSDSQSGMRAFNRKAIGKINLQTDGMEVSSEFFREIYTHKLKYLEIPIKAIYTDYSKSKGQRITNAPNIFFKLLLRLFK
jgi:glycosyltransferase involved in cell wall biosynthesis